MLLEARLVQLTQLNTYKMKHLILIFFLLLITNGNAQLIDPICVAASPFCKYSFNNTNIYSSGGGSTKRIISSGLSDNSVNADYILLWNSSSTGLKYENIPACSIYRKGLIIIIKDEYGNAAQQSITITPTSGTIDGQAYYQLYYSYGSVTIQCDGSSNWNVVSNYGGL